MVSSVSDCDDDATLPAPFSDKGILGPASPIKQQNLLKVMNESKW